MTGNHFRLKGRGCGRLAAAASSHRTAQAGGSEAGLLSACLERLLGAPLQLVGQYYDFTCSSCSTTSAVRARPRGVAMLLADVRHPRSESTSGVATRAPRCCAHVHAPTRRRCPRCQGPAPPTPASRVATGLRRHAASSNVTAQQIPATSDRPRPHLRAFGSPIPAQLLAEAPCLVEHVRSATDLVTDDLADDHPRRVVWFRRLRGSDVLDPAGPGQAASQRRRYAVASLPGAWICSPSSAFERACTLDLPTRRGSRVEGGMQGPYVMTTGAYEGLTAFTVL